MNDSFDDIISLPHHVSPTRNRMSLHDRAAQFAPFAALTGYDEEIDETARLTDDFISMTEDQSARLDSVFQEMLNSDRPDVKVIYFRPDPLKSGGSYETYRGTFRFFDAQNNVLKFTDGTCIDADMLCGLEIEK